MNSHRAIQKHFDQMLHNGLGRYGKDHNPQWMSRLDTQTGGYPLDDQRPVDVPSRVYRNIDAPRGVAMYWDQSLLAAAVKLSERSGNSRYADAVDAYIRAFIDRSVSSSGLFLWGNHYYWDAWSDSVVKFINEETPVSVDPLVETGNYHELRPYCPEWDLFWQVDPFATEAHIRAMAVNHLLDPVTGEFNRHADARNPQWQMHAFIESGGVLVQSLAWLYSKIHDKSLLLTAAKIADYSWRHRGGSTDLMINCPNSPMDRWDRHVATTEVGVWAECLLNASHLVPDPWCSSWRQMAADSVKAYLEFGWDDVNHRYLGKLWVHNGLPAMNGVTGTGETVFMPDNHSDLWQPLFPRHDYPMALARVTLELFQLTGKEVFLEGCFRWLAQIRQTLPAREGLGGYAEHYGNTAEFLLRCAKVFPRSSCFLEVANMVLKEANTLLHSGAMFRSHPGEDRCDAVDGIGFLFQAMLSLELDTKRK